MFAFSLPNALFSVLLLTNLAIAGRFNFGISDITIRETSDFSEDDLVLAIAQTGSSTGNKTWLLGSHNQDEKIQWSNLTSEFETDSSNSDLSVAFGLMNTADANDEKAFKIASAVVSVAAAFPGPQAPATKLISLTMGVLGQFLNCDGPAAIGNVIYPAADLANLNQNEKKCETKDYTYEPTTKGVCGIDNSSYSVTYCLERLDAKSASMAPASLLPGSLLYVLGLGVVMLGGGYNAFF